MHYVSSSIDKDICLLIELVVGKSLGRINFISNIRFSSEFNDAIKGEALFFEFDCLLHEDFGRPLHLSLGFFQTHQKKWFIKNQPQLSLIIREQIDKPHITKKVLAERVINIDIVRQLDRKDVIKEIDKIVRTQIVSSLERLLDIVNVL